MKVRATSCRVLAGPYDVLLAAFAQVTVGFVQLRRRDEAQASSVRCPPGDTSAGALDSGSFTRSCRCARVPSLHPYAEVSTSIRSQQCGEGHVAELWYLPSGSARSPIRNPDRFNRYYGRQLYRIF